MCVCLPIPFFLSFFFLLLLLLLLFGDRLQLSEDYVTNGALTLLPGVER